MEALRKIYVSLGLDWDSAGFASALNAASLLENAAKGLVMVFRELVGVVSSSITETTAYGSAINDAAARTGIATDALQELGFAAQLSGSSQETLFSALTRLSHTMGEAAKGSKEAAAGFSALGVRVTGPTGKLRNTEEVFAELVGRLGAISNPTDRASKALEIFGRQGTELLPLLAEGSKGLEAMRGQFRELGIGLDADGVAAADRFGDSLDTLRDVLDSFKRDLGGPLIEALQPVVDAVLEWVAANRALIRTRIQQFAQALIGVAGVLWKIFSGLAAAARFLVDQWKLLSVVVGSFLVAKFVLLNAALLETLVAWTLNTAAAAAYGATVVAVAVKAAAAWLAAAAPVVLLTAALVVAALVAEDVYGFLTGADSVIGELGPKWTRFLEEWTKPHPGDSQLMEGLRLLVKGLADLEGVALPALKEAWGDLWSYAKNTALGFFYDVQILIGRLQETLRKLFSGKLSAEAIIRENVPGASTVLDAGDAIDRFFGGAASPAAAAASSTAAAPAPTVMAPRFNASIQVVAPAGSNAESVGVLLEDRLNVWWDGKMREASETAGE